MIVIVIVIVIAQLVIVIVIVLGFSRVGSVSKNRVKRARGCQQQPYRRATSVDGSIDSNSPLDSGGVGGVLLRYGRC